MKAFQAEDWEAFRGDADAASEAMQSCLLALEESPDYSADLINTLYRALHTFKGICRMMGLPQIERVAHCAEDIVSLARDRKLPFPREGVDLLLVCLDFLQQASTRAATSGIDASESQATALVNQLGTWMKAWVPDWSPRTSGTASSEPDFILFDDEPAAPAPQTASQIGVVEVQAPQSSADSSRLAEPTSARADSGAAANQNARRKQEFVRIQAGKVKELLNLAAEIGLAAHAITKNPLLEQLDEPQLTDAAHQLNNLVRELRDAASTLALVPIGSVFTRMKRVIRDVVAETGKSVDLQIEGEDTEVDKAVVDQIADPLLHLLRNAADHGLEPTEERVRQGKRARGLITLTAAQHAGEVVISVRDDGGGLKRDRIVARAVEKGLIKSGEGMTDAQVWELIFEPGFSTAQTISKLSGRGVGMDVVRSTVAALHGTVRVTSQAGRGTCVSLHMPLSLAFLDGLVVEEKKRMFVFPLDAVSHIYKSTGTEIQKVSARRSSVVKLEGEVAPICWLRDLYGFGDAQSADIRGRVVVVLQTAKGKLAVPVERLLGSQQVTMKPLYGAFRNIRAASACGILGSGAIAIALDCEKLHDQVA